MNKRLFMITCKYWQVMEKKYPQMSKKKSQIMQDRKISCKSHFLSCNVDNIAYEDWLSALETTPTINRWHSFSLCSKYVCWASSAIASQAASFNAHWCKKKISWPRKKNHSNTQTILEKKFSKSFTKIRCLQVFLVFHWLYSFSDAIVFL